MSIDVDNIFCKLILVFLAVIMAEESEPVIARAIVWLQERQESLKDGFIVEFKGEEYIFAPTYIDRYWYFATLGLT